VGGSSDNVVRPGNIPQRDYNLTGGPTVPNLLPPADVARVTISGTFDASHWANVFHLSLNGNTLDETTFGGFLSDLQEIFTTQLFYAACSTSFGGTLIHGELSDGTAIIGGDSAAAIVGSDSDEIAPGGIAMVVSWLGSWHYRGGKPRTYVGGATTAWFDGPTLFNGGVVASLQAAAINVIETIGAYTSTNVPVAVLGALLGNSPTAHGTFAPFTGALVRNQVGSQRRRNRGH